MKTLNTYTFENNGVTATIENKKQYWSLKISSDKKVIVIPSECKIWNTLRDAKKYALVVLSNY